MEFVWIAHAGIEKPAKVPVSALPHWTGMGWVRVPPPEKPPRPPRPARPVRVRRPRPPAAPVKSTPVDAKKNTEDTKDSAKTRKAPSGRKED